MDEITALAELVVINVDNPDNSRWLKEYTQISVPVLLDNDLRVARMYDMHSRAGLPMGGMNGVPTMGFVLIDGGGTVRAMRAHIYFGRDAGYLIDTLQSF